MKRMYILAIISLLVLTFAGCNTPAEPEDPPYEPKEFTINSNETVTVTTINGTACSIKFIAALSYNNMSYYVGYFKSNYGSIVEDNQVEWTPGTDILITVKFGTYERKYLLLELRHTYMRIKENI